MMVFILEGIVVTDETQLHTGKSRAKYLEHYRKSNVISEHYVICKRCIMDSSDLFWL